MKRDETGAEVPPDCSGCRFGIVTARFHHDVAERLLEGCRRGLRDCNVADRDVAVFDVPGCFELPIACRGLAAGDRFDGLVALGAVIRGETAHFDFVAGECARGIMDVQLATGKPIGFGVLTTENLEQALARADRGGGDKGYGAAIAAASLVRLMADFSGAAARRN